MPDGTTQQSSTPASSINVGLPKGGITGGYGAVIGIGGVAFALLEIGRDDPKEFIRLLAEFGPKYLLWAGIAYMVYDVLKRLIRAISRATDNIGGKLGAMAEGMNKMAGATDTLANRNDRTADEMRRSCSFAASQAERAVDIATETHKVSTRTYEMQVAMLGKLGIPPPPPPEKEGT